MKFKLKKDIVIKAGTVFSCVDGEERKYYEGNYSHLIGLTDNTSGELVYGINTDYPTEDSEWFEEVTEKKKRKTFGLAELGKRIIHLR